MSRKMRSGGSQNNGPGQALMRWGRTALHVARNIKRHSGLDELQQLFAGDQFLVVGGMRASQMLSQDSTRKLAWRAVDIKVTIC